MLVSVIWNAIRELDFNSFTIWSKWHIYLEPPSPAFCLCSGLVAVLKMELSRIHGSAVVAMSRLPADSSVDGGSGSVGHTCCCWSVSQQRSKIKVLTCKELKWNWALKAKKNIDCSRFSCCIFNHWWVFHCSPLPGEPQNCTQTLDHKLHFSLLSAYKWMGPLACHLWYAAIKFDHWKSQICGHPLAHKFTFVKYFLNFSFY